MNRMQSVIEKTIHDLDKVVIVLSHMSPEELDLDVTRAIAQGGFEMAGTIVHHLEHVLPSFTAGADDTPVAAVASASDIIQVQGDLLASTRENLDEVLTAFVLALHDEGRLSQQERDAVARSAVERLRRIVQGDLSPYAPRVAEAALTD